MAIGDGRQAEHDRGAAPADRGDQRHADEGHDHRPDVAAGDVGADREASPLRRELLGQQAVADRVLRRAADPRQDVGDGEGQEPAGQRLGREPAAEQDPAGAQQPPSRDDPGQRGVAELDHARREAADRRQEGDRLDAHPELVDHLEVDQRQDDGLGVVHRVGDGQQPERARRVDLGARLIRVWCRIVGLPRWANASAARAAASGICRRVRSGGRRSSTPNPDRSSYTERSPGIADTGSPAGRDRSGRASLAPDPAGRRAPVGIGRPARPMPVW